MTFTKRSLARTTPVQTLVVTSNDCRGIASVKASWPKQMHNKEVPFRGGSSVDTSRLKQLHSSQEVETKMHWMNLHC